MNRGGPAAPSGTRPITQSLRLTPGRLPSTASGAPRTTGDQRRTRNSPTRPARPDTHLPGRPLPKLGEPTDIEPEVLTGEATSTVHSEERSPVGVTVALCVAALGLALAGAWDVHPSDATSSGLWSVLSIETYVSVIAASVAVGLVLSKRPMDTRLTRIAFGTLFVVVDVIPVFVLARVGTPLSTVRVGIIDQALKAGEWGSVPTDRGIWSAGTAAIGGLARILGLDTVRSFAVWLPALLHLGLILPAALWARRLNSVAGRWITIGFVIVFGGFAGDVLNGDALAALIAACLFAAFSEQFDEFGSVIQPKSLLPAGLARGLRARRDRDAHDELASGGGPGFSAVQPDRRSVPRRPEAGRGPGIRHDRLAVVSALSLTAIAVLSLPVFALCALILIVFALKDLVGPSTKLIAWGAGGAAMVMVAFRSVLGGGGSGGAGTSARLDQAVSLANQLAADALPSWSSGSTSQRFWMLVGLGLLVAVTGAVIHGWGRATLAEKIVVSVGGLGGILFAGPGPLLGRALLMTSPAVGVMVARRFDDLSDDQEVVDRHSLGVTLLSIVCILATFGFGYATLASTTLRDSDVAAVEWITEHSATNSVVLTADASAPWAIDEVGARPIVPVGVESTGNTGVNAGGNAAGNDLAEGISDAAERYRSEDDAAAGGEERAVYALLTVSAERRRLDPIRPNVATNGQLAQALQLSTEWEVVFQTGGSFVLHRL